MNNMNESKTIIIFILFVFLATSCQYDENQYDASGTFEAQEILISSESNGKILELNIREGEILKAEQLVGYIDSTQLYLQKKLLENNIKSVEIRSPEIHKQIAVIEQQINTQKREKNRIENLVKANVAGQKQLDDINSSIAVLEKQLDAQYSTLSINSKGLIEDIASINIQISKIEDQLNKCRIINPIDGTVLTKYAEAHELTLPGKALYKIADMENMIFRAYLCASQLSEIKTSDKVKIFADFGNEVREYIGEVQWISSKSEFTPKTIQTKDERANQVYAVKIAVKNDGNLKIGMYGSLILNKK